MVENKLIGVISLGCDKNRVDTEKMIALLKEKGCKFTNSVEEAQIVIVNTCAFLESSRAEAIETVIETAECKKRNLEKIVVTGCLPQKYVAEIFDPLTEADVFSGIDDYSLLFDALEKSYQTDERINIVGQGNPDFYLKRELTTDYHYAYLKIADGCFNHCTYCLIPKIRGKYRSYPMESLLEEAAGLGDISELILVAQDTTRYGEDLYKENRFVELIRKLSELENIGSIRLLYCYPEMITDPLIAEIKNNPKVIKYLDIPLQHSENRILKLMGRRGSREEYLSLFGKLRKEIPNIAIRSTFISGFPTETDEEHEGLKSFLNEAKLENCGFFAYSREPDTGAYKMQPQIKASVKKRRVKELYALQRKISSERNNAYIGKFVKILCDGIDYDKNCFVGRTEFQAPDIDGKVYFNATNAVQGEVYDVLIKKADAYDLFGCTKEYQC